MQILYRYILDAVLGRVWEGFYSWLFSTMVFLRIVAHRYYESSSLYIGYGNLCATMCIIGHV